MSMTAKTLRNIPIVVCLQLIQIVIFKRFYLLYNEQTQIENERAKQLSFAQCGCTVPFVPFRITNGRLAAILARTVILIARVAALR